MVNEEWKSRLEGGGPSCLPGALNVMFSFIEDNMCGGIPW